MLIMREMPSNSLRMIDSLTALSAPPSTTEINMSPRRTLWNWFCSAWGADHLRKAIKAAAQIATAATIHAPRRNAFCCPLLLFVILKELFRSDQLGVRCGRWRRHGPGCFRQIAVFEPELFLFSVQNTEVE